MVPNSVNSRLTGDVRDCNWELLHAKQMHHQSLIRYGVPDPFQPSLSSPAPTPNLSELVLTAGMRVVPGKQIFGTSKFCPDPRGGLGLKN